MSWIPGSHKPDPNQVAAAIWYWQLQSAAYSGMCEVTGDLYWLDPYWNDIVDEYCRRLLHEQ